MWVKSKFVLYKPRYYNLLTEKSIKKFTFLKYYFFGDIPFLSISRNSLRTPSLDDIFWGNFTLLNSIILVKGQIRGNRGVEILVFD